MATKKTTAPEPLNSEQLAAIEAVTGASAGELEERTVEAETRADAAERRAGELESELAKLQTQVAALMRANASARSARRDELADVQPLDAEGLPVFDESTSHGVVVGDTEVAYVQNGHQFSRDKKFIATEQHRGVSRAFNPRLVGYVKPRPGAAVVDSLDGIRDAS
jgi:hypothetical protein